jgi:hypothetical protein
MTSQAATRCAYRRAIHAAVAGVIACSFSRPAIAEDQGSSPIHRVRSSSNRIGQLISLATQHSVTFKGLAETIDGTNGLVYVDEGKCGHSVRACLSLSVKVAGPNRLLRIIVDARQPDCELMADIGHELQHAVEALGDAHVKDTSSAYSFFERIGPTGSDRFETAAALHAGDRVDNECHEHREETPGRKILRPL